MSTDQHEGPVFDLDRAQKILADAGIDLLIASRRPNIAWLSGCFGIYHWTYPDVAHFLDMESDGCEMPFYFAALGSSPHVNPFAVAHDTQMAWLKGGWIQDVRPCCWHPGKRNPVDVIADAIEERGLSTGHLAVEMRHLPALVLDGLRKRLPKAEWVDAGPVFWEMRSVKSAREVERQRQAYRIAEEIYREVFEMIRRGDGTLTVNDVRAAQMAMATRAGCPPLYFGYVFPQNGKDKRAWDFARASSFKIERGDAILLDIGVIWRGYTTDFGRNVVWGKVAPRVRERYALMKECRERIIPLLKPGVRACDLFEQAMAVRKELGLPSAPHIGHSLGVECQENPSLVPTDRMIIREGMTLVIELCDGIDGVMFLLEDAGLVTADGWKSLTAMSTELVELD